MATRRRLQEIQNRKRGFPEFMQALALISSTVDSGDAILELRCAKLCYTHQQTRQQPPAMFQVFARNNDFVELKSAYSAANPHLRSLR